MLLVEVLLSKNRSLLSLVGGGPGVGTGFAQGETITGQISGTTAGLVTNTSANTDNPIYSCSFWCFFFCKTWWKYRLLLDWEMVEKITNKLLVLNRLHSLFKL